MHARCSLAPVSPRLELQRRKLNHSTARTLAALLGTVPVALGAGVVLAQALPLSPAKRYLVGNFSVFPLWVGLCLWVFLAPNGKRAWIGLVAASALLGLGIVLGRSTGNGPLPLGVR